MKYWTPGGVRGINHAFPCWSFSGTGLAVSRWSQGRHFSFSLFLFFFHAPKIAPGGSHRKARWSYGYPMATSA